MDEDDVVATLGHSMIECDRPTLPRMRMRKPGGARAPAARECRHPEAAVLVRSAELKRLEWRLTGEVQADLDDRPDVLWRQLQVPPTLEQAFVKPADLLLDPALNRQCPPRGARNRLGDPSVKATSPPEHRLLDLLGDRPVRRCRGPPGYGRPCARRA